MSDIDLLRRAATLMRDRANAVDADGWESWYDPSNQPDGAHIASWHPAVALAVADWLDAEAEALDAALTGRPAQLKKITPIAAIARAYLGENA